MAQKNIEDLRARIDNLEFLCIYLLGQLHDQSAPDTQRILGQMNTDFIKCAETLGSEMPNMSEFKVEKVIPAPQIILNGDIKK